MSLGLEYLNFVSLEYLLLLFFNKMFNTSHLTFRFLGSVYLLNFFPGLSFLSVSLSLYRSIWILFQAVSPHYRVLPFRRS